MKAAGQLAHCLLLSAAHGVSQCLSLSSQSVELQPLLIVVKLSLLLNFTLTLWFIVNI